MKKTAMLLILALIWSCAPGNEKTEEKSENSIAEPVSEPKSAWQVVPIVDAFGDEVPGKSAIIGLFEGRMKNGLGSNQKVTVKVQITEDYKTFITFYEYGSSIGTLPKEDIFKIQIKKSDGSSEFIQQFSYDNILSDSKGILGKAFLAQSEPLKVNVDLSRHSGYLTTVYNFEIDPTGLTDLMNEH